MRFLLQKDEKEKMMNKMLKAIKQSVKSSPDDDYEGLAKACTDSVSILYTYLCNNIDYGENKIDEE